jgi:uncharacterized protein YhbP (UPF0306 family)
MRPVARHRIERAVLGLLGSSTLCAISTVSPRNTPHINTAYFAWNHEFDVVWLSDPAARHSANIRARPTTAIAVYDSHQKWGKPDRGIQLFGSTRELPKGETAAVEQLYAARFSAYATPDLIRYRFYRFQPQRVKLFDEPVLGAGVFVTARVGHGHRLFWERTDIYSGTSAD